MPIAPLNVLHHNVHVTGDLSIDGELQGMAPLDYVPVFVAGSNVAAVPVVTSAKYVRVGSEIRVSILTALTNLTALTAALETAMTVTLPVPLTSITDQVAGTWSLGHLEVGSTGHVYNGGSTTVATCNLVILKTFALDPSRGHLQFSYFV